jgi:hypothetical protein
VGAGEGIGILAGSTRVHDFLVAGEDIRHLSGKGAARAKEVHLKNERRLVLVLFQQILQRRVRDDAAVPIIFPLDLDRWKRRLKRARGHDVLGPDLLLLGVEIDEIAGPHIDRADAKLVAIIQKIEIDELFERIS